MGRYKPYKVYIQPSPPHYFPIFYLPLFTSVAKKNYSLVGGGLKAPEPLPAPIYGCVSDRPTHRFVDY
jgi:hypothetical protein